MTIPVVGFVFALIGCLVAGVVGGYFLARYLFQNQMEKNPPITKEMLRAMYKSMGRTPSEADLNRTMNAMKQAQKKSSKK